MDFEIDRFVVNFSKHHSGTIVQKITQKKSIEFTVEKFAVYTIVSECKRGPLKRKTKSGLEFGTKQGLRYALVQFMLMCVRNYSNIK